MPFLVLRNVQADKRYLGERPKASEPSMREEKWAEVRLVQVLGRIPHTGEAVPLPHDSPLPKHLK